MKPFTVLGAALGLFLALAAGIVIGQSTATPVSCYSAVLAAEEIVDNPRSAIGWSIVGNGPVDDWRAASDDCRNG